MIIKGFIITLHKKFLIDTKKLFIISNIVRDLLIDHVKKRRVGDFLFIEYKNRKIFYTKQNTKKMYQYILLSITR